MEPNQNNGKYQYIGDIAKQLGVSTRSIRYYEELGLIIPKRTDGGYREYSHLEIEKLRTILRLKRLGFSLDDIQKFIKMRTCITDRDSARELLGYLHERLHNFEEKIKEYKKGIKEITSMINIIENCSVCKEQLEIFKCERCLEEQDKEMPPLMKTLL